MERVLFNLVENAIKYSPEGGEVRIFNRQENSQLIIGVSDQGPGISKEETERLGFLHARNPQESLDMAFSLLSRDAKVAVLRRGGEILPAINPSRSGTI